MKVWSKFLEIIEKLFSKFPYLAYIGVFLIFSLFAFGIYHIKEEFLTASFTVEASNFNADYKKIPIDIGYVDFTLSKNINSLSVNKKSIQIEPKVEGEVKVINGNTLRYIFLSPLKVGQDLSITLSPNIKSSEGESLGEKHYEVIVSEQARVTSITPSGKTTNLGQNIDVFFNVPMIALSTLDTKAQLPCPIKIEPALTGTCKWLTSSVAEFTPEKSLRGATKYHITAVSTGGLLYPFVAGSGVTIETPHLEAYVSDTFSAPQDISLRFNFPVNIDTLKANVSLKEIDEKGKGTEKAFDIIPSKESEAVFTLSLKGGKFCYNTNYQLFVKKGLYPKEGNISLDNDFVANIHSLPFLSSTEVYRNIYSNTGELIDTQYFSPDQKFPVKGGVFHLGFEEEISSLDKSNFTFVSDSGSVDFDVNYIKEQEYNPDGSLKRTYENKKRIALTLKQNLLPNTKYTFIVRKSISPNLESDITQTYKVADSLKVSKVDFLNYSKYCVYTNNPLSNQDTLKETLPLINPKAKVLSVDNYQWFAEDVQSLTGTALREKGYCPEVPGQTLSIVNPRLAPNTAYTLGVEKGIQDIYGNTLETSFTIPAKTGEISDADKYLYNSVSKDVNFIPENLPINVDVQSINMTGARLDVCELDEKGFMDYRINSGNPGYTLRCKQKYEKEIALKNHFWNLTNNIFDIEKDIVGKPLHGKYILVRGYKGKEKSFATLYVRGNINMTLESGENKKQLFVSDFSGNVLKEGLSFTFYRYDYSKNSFQIVNPKITPTKDGRIYDIEPMDITYIFAKSEHFSGVIDTINDSLYNDDFGYIGGVSSYDKNYAYIYTERPIYKPQDTVYVKGIIRKFNFDGYKKVEIGSGKLEVLDKDFNVIYTSQISIDANSNFSTSFILPKEVPLGEFNFRFTYKNEEYMNNAHFYVEEYRKPDFKIDVDGGKTDSLLGETYTTTLSPAYYFGGEIAETMGKSSILTQKYYFDAKDYADYQFGEGQTYFDCLYWGSCSYDDNLSGVQDFAVHGGKYNFTYQLPKDATDEKIYSFNFDVSDPNTQKVVSKTVSTVAHITDGYVGLQTNYWNTQKDGIKAKIITLDYGAKPLASKKVQAHLIKRDWKSVKKQGVDGVFYEDYTLEEKEIETTSVTTNTNGEGNISFAPKEGGEYMIRVSYMGNNGKAFTSSNILYVSGDEYTIWNNGNNDITDLVSVKQQVQVGETAEYMFKSPTAAGQLFVNIEKDNGILDTYVFPVTSYGQKISFPVKDSYYPNYYVKAFFVGTEVKNPLPIYKRALTVTKVNTKYKNLKVTITPEKRGYLPGEAVKLTVQVADINGKPISGANGSLSLVDESLLALKGNPKKNPYAFFYDLRRYLGTETASLYKNLIEKLEIKDTTNGEKGGAGDQIKGGNSTKARGVFKDTAFWQADFTTDANGKAVITTSKLPDNLTTWVIEALVSSADTTKVGVGYDSILTTKQLLIQENLPNFVISNDTIQLAPVVFNKTGVSGEFTVSLVGKNISLDGKSSQKVFIKDGSSQIVPFTIKIPPKGSLGEVSTPLATITLKASDKDGKQSDTVIKNLAILSDSEKETTTTTGKTNGVGSDEKVDIPTGSGDYPSLKITYGATLFSSVLESVDYLANYPYGCSEQKTSAVLPNMYIKKLYDSLGKPFDLKQKKVPYYDEATFSQKEKSLDQILQEYLTDIRKYQKNDGGFVYWYDTDTQYQNYSDFQLSSYILSANSTIRDIGGYTLNAESMKNLQKYLKARFYKNQREGCIVTEYNDCKYDETERLQALEALLTFQKNDYEVYKMYKLLNLKNPSVSTLLKKVKVIALLQNVTSIVTSQKEALIKDAKETLQQVQNDELVQNPKGAYIGRSENYTRVQNTSYFLEDIALLSKNISFESTLVDSVQRWLIAQKKGGNFGSTQDTLSAIQAISTYFTQVAHPTETTFASTLKFNSNQVAKQSFTQENLLSSYTKTLSGSMLLMSNTFNALVEGKGTLYYDLSLGYYLPLEKLQARDEGFALSSGFYNYDEYKKIQSEKQIEWNKYLSGSISIDELKYPKDIFEYLTPMKTLQVGQLAIAHTTIINSETRDRVAFESYIPSGSEIVNPNLDTSSKTASEFENSPFEKAEYRTDRFFGYTNTLYPGIHEVSYLVRFTHAGKYSLKPTNAYEFYNPEVFGRTAGKMLEIIPVEQK